MNCIYECCMYVLYYNVSCFYCIRANFVSLYVYIYIYVCMYLYVSIGFEQAIAVGIYGGQHFSGRGCDCIYNIS